MKIIESLMLNKLVTLADSVYIAEYNRENYPAERALWDTRIAGIMSAINILGLRPLWDEMQNEAERERAKR